MMDGILKAPIWGFYFVLIPLLWLFAFNAINHVFIEEDWSYKLLYLFFFLAEISCSIGMLYSLYRVFFY